jgi:4-hydroxy-2-oxoheptanedioate aldolase
MNYVNTVHEKLDAGQTVLGCFLPPTGPEWVEIIALAGFDFALLDTEHGWITPATAYPLVLAAEAHGIEAFCRIGYKDKQDALKYLDLGVSGVMFPQIANADEAEAMIAGSKYAPRGTRGLAGGRQFEFGMRRPAPQVVPDLDQRTMTIIQFEHVDTLPHLDAILATPDLDILFVGPNDLAQSLGLPGQPNHPDVTAVGDEVVARCKAAGIKTGTTAPTAEAAKWQASRGFDMIVANGPVLLAQAATGYVSQFTGDSA